MIRSRGITELSQAGEAEARGARTGGTRESLLRAAESLFARHGTAQASLRAITQEAGANLASVHYYFGSKDGLVRAVFARRLEPLNRQRLELLSRVEDASGGRPPVDHIVRAFVAPVLSMIKSYPDGPSFARLVVRVFSEPGEELRDILLEQFRGVIERFTGALCRALPHLQRSDVIWRFHFMVGSMVHTAEFGSLISRISEGINDPWEADDVTERLVAFVTAGMVQAPAAHRGGVP